MMKKTKQGFTLIELLVVIGILAILTAVVLVAVNPGRQLAQARNTARGADINAILTAVTAYVADPVNNGSLPPSMASAPNCLPGPAGAVGTGGINLALDLAPTYIADIPMDPSVGTAADTGYTICIADATANRITIAAPSAELNLNLSVTR